ncbi:general substrate transporter [Aspergillus cavernicola]|uniref:General substrate transporter n=1 Tax=Aspergillus cavernicola TaxID=176166 RepID=A0ABR4I9H9_9EURO
MAADEHNTDRFSIWWKDLGFRKLIFWQTTILLSQMTTGYDESLVGSLQAMQPWVDDMGNPDSSRIGLITCILFVGAFAGSFMASPAADHFGRRVGMLVGASATLAGAIIQTVAPNSATFIGGRFVIGFGIAFTCVSGPSLLFELAHPAMRGTITLTFNVLWYVGSIIAAWTTFGTGHMANSWSWRIPSVIQAVPALLLVLSVLLGLPESPRWLCSQGRTEEARKLLAKYHSNGDLSSELVKQEIDEITFTLEAEQLAKFQHQSSWSIIFRSPANRKRIAVVMTVALLTLWNGQGVISYYFSPILSSIGITSTDQQTGINGGLQIWNLLSSIAGVLLANRVGRRNLWLGSFIGMIFANVPLTISSAMYKDHSSKPAGYVAVVFLFLYNAAFNTANNPLLYSYPTEILTFPIRAKGLSIMVATSQAALTVNQYVNPIALDRIGYYYYIFYLGMLISGTLVIYFTFPETKDKSEAELAALFDEGHDAGSIEGVETGYRPDGASGQKEGAIVKAEGC